MPATDTYPIDDTDVCAYCGRSDHIESEPLSRLVVRGLGGHPDGIHQDDEEIGTTYACSCGAWCDHIDGEPVTWMARCVYCGETAIQIHDDYEAGQPCSACRELLRGALALVKEVRS